MKTEPQTKSACLWLGLQHKRGFPYSICYYADFIPGALDSHSCMTSSIFMLDLVMETYLLVLEISLPTKLSWHFPTITLECNIRSHHPILKNMSAMAIHPPFYSYWINLSGNQKQRKNINSTVRRNPLRSETGKLNK